MEKWILHFWQNRSYIKEKNKFDIFQMKITDLSFTVLLKKSGLYSVMNYGKEK